MEISSWVLTAVFHGTGGIELEHFRLHSRSLEILSSWVLTATFQGTRDFIVMGIYLRLHFRALEMLSSWVLTATFQGTGDVVLSTYGSFDGSGDFVPALKLYHRSNQKQNEA